MNILVTGAAGALGRNLVENLKAIRDGKNRTRPSLRIDEIYEYDLDSTPEDLGYAMEALFRAGALDGWYTPIGMKKSRPAVMLSCLGRAEQREALLRCLFRHTGTLGVREFPCSRVTLTRSFRTADTPWGPVRIKHAEGFGVVREKAEYEDLKAIAEKEKLTLTEVRKALKDPPA